MFQGFFNRKPEYLSGKSDCLSLNIYIYTHAIYVSPENDTKKKNERTDAEHHQRLTDGALLQPAHVEGALMSQGIEVQQLHGHRGRQLLKRGRPGVDGIKPSYLWICYIYI